MKPLSLPAKKQIHGLLKHRLKFFLGVWLLGAAQVVGFMGWNYYKTPADSTAAQDAQRVELSADLDRLGKIRDRYNDVHKVAQTLDADTARLLGITLDRPRLEQIDKTAGNMYADAVKQTSLKLAFATSLSTYHFEKLAYRLADETPKEFVPASMLSFTSGKAANSFLQSCRAGEMSKPGFAPSEETAQAVSTCSIGKNSNVTFGTFIAQATLVGLLLGSGALRRRWDKEIPEEEEAARLAAAAAKATEQQAVAAKIGTGTGKAITVKPIKLSPKSQITV